MAALDTYLRERGWWSEYSHPGRCDCCAAPAATVLRYCYWPHSPRATVPQLARAFITARFLDLCWPCWTEWYGVVLQEIADDR